MPTMKDFLLLNTTLPTTGLYNYSDHFRSFISKVTADKVGEVVINDFPKVINLSVNKVEIMIKQKKQSAEVSQNTEQVLIDGTNKIKIVIDADC
jgi:hypothetical protein